MIKALVVFAVLAIFGASFGQAFAQEIGLATFQENAQVIIDKSLSKNVTASITLQSTSNQEMQIPSALEQKIRENDRVIAVILTNEENCVLGVFAESCIMINVNRDFEFNNIVEIQEDAKRIGAMYIDDINEFFDTNAEFHSVFIHHRDGTNVALDTSGVVSGRGTVSVVYTMPQEATDSMYEKISAILVPKVIRESGGFYDSAISLSKDERSRMTFSIIPMDVASLFQLKVGINYPNIASSINQINPLEYLQTDQLTRSDYFSGGFYPLNSLVQVVVLSSEPTKISDVKGKIVPTQIIDGEKIPTDVTTNGWVFDPEEGEKIQGKYLFGKKSTITSSELLFAIDGETVQNPNTQTEFDESIIVVIIIVIIGILAALFYLKGYKK